MTTSELYLTEMLDGQGQPTHVHEGIETETRARELVEHMQFAMKLIKKPPTFRCRLMTATEVARWKKQQAKNEVPL